MLSRSGTVFPVCNASRGSAARGTTVSEAHQPVNQRLGRPARPWTVEELMVVATASGRYEPLIVWLELMGTRWAETVGLE